MAKVPQAVYDKYNEFVDSFTSSDFGVNCTLKYPPKALACINCVYDQKSKRSSNTYKLGGPEPFTFGVCPWCGGKGSKEEIITEVIKLRCYWERKSWVDVGIPLNIPDGAVQTIGYLSDFPKIKKSQKAILNSDQIAFNTWEYVLFGEPIPHGFKRNRYIIAYWTRA